MPFIKTTSKNLSHARPFLKWAGGKSQLLEQIIQFLPPDIAIGKIKKYVEPFVGSGAMFIYLSQCVDIDEMIIGDINEELIIAYKTIQKNVEKLIDYLLNLQKEYLLLDFITREKYYYKIRETFNYQKSKIDLQIYDYHWIERTAQLIFLNRTCFNGLFRVNSKGHFNVPAGKYENPLICNRENLRAIAQLLQKTKIYQGCYTQCEQWIDSQTFVYFDPPYRPISQTSNFTAYSKNSFDDDEQLKLRDFYQLLDSKKAKLMLSNSDPKNQDSDDNFFEDAYRDYRIERIQANRSINCNAAKRGQINELLFMNY